MNELAEQVRRGRPPNEAPVKKGHSTWKPANVDETYDKDPNYRYRWINEDETNVSKKKMENWEVVSDTAGSQTKSDIGYGRIDDGKPMTSVRKRVGQILARMPQEIAEGRDTFFNSKTARSVSALKRDTSKGIDGKAPIHGSITIEKKGIRNIIKE